MKWRTDDGGFKLDHANLTHPQAGLWKTVIGAV